MATLNFTDSKGVHSYKDDNHYYTYDAIVGVSMIMRGFRRWLGSAFSTTLVINILSLILFPVALILLLIGFYFGSILKKSMRHISKVDFDHLTLDDYESIQKMVAGNKYEGVVSISTKKIRFTSYPFIMWGFLIGFKATTKLFAKHYQRCKVFVEELDSAPPKDVLLKHIPSNKLWKERNKNYEYLV